MSNGVNYFGSLETFDGIGRAAALNIESLLAAEIETAPYVLSRPVALQTGRNVVIDDDLIKSLKNNINIFHFSARWVPHYLSLVTKNSLSNHYNIGYWVCEVPSIPAVWAQQLDFFDEIWTASSFCQAAISKSSHIPVIKIPHPIEDRELSSRILSRKAGGNEGEFTFLSIFNVYSDAERKNILFTIRAFLSAFGDRSDVRLIVKVSNLEHDFILSKKLFEISKNFVNIEIIEGYAENSVVQKLYEQADVYVSLHRAEGFGLTISDAMSRGIPVITTGYSGNMEFCLAQDTRLVKYQLRNVGHNRLRYRKDDVWAEPDMEDAKAALIELVSDYPNWLRKAACARERISETLSIFDVGQLMFERIQLINGKFNHPNEIDRGNLDREVGICETYGF